MGLITLKYLALILVMVTLITAVHEGGHMLTAKAQGIGVIEYAVGFGPALFKKKYRDTTYSLRILPLGGFCRIQDTDDEGPGGGLRDRGPLLRASVLLAGPFSNFLLAFIISALTLSMYGYHPARVSEVIVQGPSEGILQEGDLITSVDGKRVMSMSEVGEITELTRGKAVSVTFERDGIPMKALIKPQKMSGVYKLGVVFIVEDKKCSLSELIPCSLHHSYSIARYLVMLLEDAARGGRELQLAGVIGVAGEVGSVMENAQPEGAAIGEFLLYILCSLSVSIGVFNLLPLPGLDGGGVLFSFLELLTGKDLERQENALGRVTGLMLLVLFVYVFWSDIASIRGVN